MEEAARQKRRVNLLVKHRVCEDCCRDLYLAFTPWRTLQALACDTVIFNCFDADRSWNALLKIESSDHFNEAVIIVLGIFCCS